MDPKNDLALTLALYTASQYGRILKLKLHVKFCRFLHKIVQMMTLG